MLSVCERREQAVAEFEHHRIGPDAKHAVQALDAGIAHLRDAYAERVHEDLEEEFGQDSMLAPPSLAREAQQILEARREIEAYSCFLVANEITRHCYLDNAGDWILDWVLHLRFGDNREFAAQRAAVYRSMTPRERHVLFISLLKQALPESKKAPGVLFHLFNRGVKIVAAIAFGKTDRAQAAAETAVRDGSCY